MALKDKLKYLSAFKSKSNTALRTSERLKVIILFGLIYL